MRRHCKGGVPCDYCWKMNHECIPRRRIKYGEGPKEHQRLRHGSGSSSSDNSTSGGDGEISAGNDGGGDAGGVDACVDSIGEMGAGVSECAQTDAKTSALKTIEELVEERERAENNDKVQDDGTAVLSSSSSSSSSAADYSSVLTGHHHHRQQHPQHQQHDFSFILSELYFHRQDPRPHVSLYLLVFKEMHAQGKISRQRALWMLRAWGIQSALVDADVTWGLAKTIATLMNITAADIEEKEMLALGPTLEGQRRLAAAAAAKAKRMSNELKIAARFRVLDEQDGGRRGIRMTVFHEKELYLFHWANGEYERLFRDPVDGYDDLIRRKSMRLFSEICIVSPEDREQYLRCFLEVVYGCLPSGSSQTELLKMASRTGAIGVFLVKRQHTRTENGEEETVTYLEPAPRSRYVTSTPWAYNRTHQNFRRGGVSLTSQSPSSPSPLPPPPLALCPSVPLCALSKPQGEGEQMLHKIIMEKRAAAIFPPPPPASSLSTLALLSSSYRHQQREGQDYTYPLHTHAYTHISPQKREEKQHQGQIRGRQWEESSMVGREKETKENKKGKKDDSRAPIAVATHAGVDINPPVSPSSPSPPSSSLPFVYAHAQHRKGEGEGEEVDVHLWVEGPGRKAPPVGDKYDEQQQQQQQQQEEKAGEEERAGEDFLTSLLPILDEGVDLFDVAIATAIEEMNKEEET